MIAYKTLILFSLINQNTYSNINNNLSLNVNNTNFLDLKNSIKQYNTIKNINTNVSLISLKEMNRIIIFLNIVYFFSNTNKDFKRLLKKSINYCEKYEKFLEKSSVKNNINNNKFTYHYCNI